MLLNLSNHPADNWPEKQKQAAQEMFGAIRDLPFPHIPPEWDIGEVEKLVEKYLEKIYELGQIGTVHIQGEFTFTFALVRKLQESHIRCIVSTTRRIVEAEKDGTKVSRFEFVRFRDYPKMNAYGKEM